MATLLMLPNIVAMLMLMGVLGWLYREHRDASVKFWLLGLTFVLVEAISVAVYKTSGALRPISHVVALDAYLLAGVTFGWAAGQDFLPGRRDLPFFTLPAMPMLVLCTLYGLGVTGPAAYVDIAALSLVIGLIYVSLMPAKGLGARLGLVGIHVGIWLPMTWMAVHGLRRALVYWGLGCLYLLVAFSFRCRVRRGAIGGIVIVAGFTIWAGCFFAHPYQASNAALDAFNEQLWTMQKFVVLLGMLLTLLEEAKEKLKREAMHDPLTGLPNRRLFDDRLEQAMGQVAALRNDYRAVRGGPGWVQASERYRGSQSRRRDAASRGGSGSRARCEPPTRWRGAGGMNSA